MSRKFLPSVMVLSMLIVQSTLSYAGSRPADSGGRAATSPVVFVAHDYGFSGPSRIPAGVTTVRVVNKGQDFHHLQLLKLRPGKTADDLRAAISADAARLPDWIHYVGGPNAVNPGGEAMATMNLTEGDYMLVCLIPDQHGVLHMALGMQKPVSVRRGKPTTVAAPQPSITITQADFQFSIAEAITPGFHTVQVINHGTQPHEVVLVRLDPGASVKDLLASVEPGASGPPRGKFIGSIVGLEGGQHGFFTARFEPGHYGLICFFPDRVTGQPHFLRGMTAEFRVK